MKVIGYMILFLLIIGLLLGLVLGGFGYLKYRDAVEQRPLSETVEEVRNRSDYVKLDELPEIYLQGVVAVEDKRFYRHPGFDPFAMVRALKNDVKARGFVEGGSTITQQLAKNLYFTNEKNIFRKTAEIFLAARMEREFSKDEILELYVNCIYFGREAYGVTEASRIYFNKEPQDLNAAEATMLAGIPNAPSYLDPISNPDGARLRQKRVIRDLIKRGYITREEGEHIYGGPVGYKNGMDEDPFLFLCNHYSEVTGSEAVVDIYNRRPCSAGVQHCEERGQSFKRGTVSYGGRDSYDGTGCQPSHYGEEGSFHPGDYDDHIGASNLVFVGEEAVDSRHSRVVDPGYRGAEVLRGYRRLFRYGQVGGSGADHQNLSSRRFRRLSYEKEPGVGFKFSVRKGSFQSLSLFFF